MTTSGITTDNLTALDLITAAFNKLNLITLGQAPTDGMAQSALSDLNLMIKTWATLPHLWLVARASQALTASQATYTLAAGVRKVLRVQKRTSGHDLSLVELSAQDYDELPNKSQTGAPLSFYQDRQRGAVTLYVWLVPDAATAASTTLQYTYARQIEVFTTLTQTCDLPEEWQEAIIYNLAVRLIAQYGADPQTEAEVKAMAGASMGQLVGQDQESGSLFFQPTSAFNR